MPIDEPRGPSGFKHEIDFEDDIDFDGDIEFEYLDAESGKSV